MKRLFILVIIGLSLISAAYAGETPAAYDQAKILYQRSIDTDSVEIKKECRKKILELVPDSDLGYFSKAWLLG